MVRLNNMITIQLDKKLIVIVLLLILFYFGYNYLKQKQVEQLDAIETECMANLLEKGNSKLVLPTEDPCYEVHEFNKDFFDDY